MSIGIKVNKNTIVVNEEGKKLYDIKAYKENLYNNSLDLLLTDRTVIKIQLEKVRYFYKVDKNKYLLILK